MACTNGVQVRKSVLHTEKKLERLLEKQPNNDVRRIGVAENKV